LDSLNDATTSTTEESGSLSIEAATGILTSINDVLPPPPPPDAPAGTSGTTSSTDQQTSDAHVATSALNVASTVLASSTQITTQAATEATEILSFVLSQPTVVADTSGSDQVQSSVNAISDSVLNQSSATETNLTVVITTRNLNITAEKRSAEAVAEAPATCQTETEPAVVSLPPNVLTNTQVNESLPIDMLLYSSSVNLHDMIIDGADESFATSANVTLSSPLISFSLRQGGKEIIVAGVQTPINITLPLKKGANTTDKCVGQPENASSTVCKNYLECRYWSETQSKWLSSGCRTLYGSTGSVVCECDHLTDL